MAMSKMTSKFLKVLEKVVMAVSSQVLFFPFFLSLSFFLPIFLFFMNTSLPPISPFRKIERRGQKGRKKGKITRKGGPETNGTYYIQTKSEQFCMCFLSFLNYLCIL